MEDKQIKLFLDDIRIPMDCVPYMYKRIGNLNPIYLEKWEIVRNYDDFVNAINLHKGKITHISFDHDLSDEHYHGSMYSGKEAYEKYLENIKEKTGLDCAKYFKKIYDEENLQYPVLFVHSMNPVGTENIINLFK